MAFENYTQTENAESTLDGDLWTSATTVLINTWEWALFPPTYPFILVLEQFDSSDNVIAREITKCTWSPAIDQLTIVRQFAPCVQDETANPKTQTNNAQSFLSGDKISLYFTAVDQDDLKDEVVDLRVLLDDKLDISTYDAEKAVYTSSSTWTDAYAVTVSEVTSYNAWQVFKVSADVANTWSATLEVNSLWAKILKKLSNSAFNDLETGDIIANQIFWATYNGAQDVFQFSVDPANVAIPDISWISKNFTTSENITQWKAIWINSSWDVELADSNFIWFAKETVTSWNTISIDISWVNNNQTWLTISDAYYLKQDTWNILNASNDNITFSVNSQETNPTSFFYRADWLKLYVVWLSNDRVYQYTLSTAWDITSATYDSLSFWVSPQTSSPYWMFFKDDWTKMYITWGNFIYQYTLSTAWNVSTASYDSISHNFGAQESNARWFYFSNDWLSLYIILDNADIYQYNLWTAWQISTISYTWNSKTISSESQSYWIYLKDDLSRMYTVWQTNRIVYQYTLSTPWDISTATYDNVNFLTDESVPRSISFKDDFSKFYVIWTSGDRVRQFSTPWVNIPWEIDNVVTWTPVWRAISSTEILINTWWF